MDFPGTAAVLSNIKAAVPYALDKGVTTTRWHGGEGTAQEAAAAIGFSIYRTEEMAELISYMRQYNESALEGEDLRFYGFDMQRISYSMSEHW